MLNQKCWFCGEHSMTLIDCLDCGQPTCEDCMVRSRCEPCYERMRSMVEEYERAEYLDRERVF